LKGYLEEDEQERAVINTHDAKDSREAVYEDLRERLGPKHPLTIKARNAAKNAVERVNAFKARLWKAIYPNVQ
jgi:hypothetical protein